MRWSWKLFFFGVFLIIWAAPGYDRLPPERIIHLDERREGTFRPRDPIRRAPPRGPAHRWAFNGQAGQQITIIAESYEFDTYLLLIDPRGEQIAWSDDSDGLFNARIRATLPAAGRYRVIVCGVNADQYGTYWLSLEEGDREADWSEEAVSTYYRRGIEWAERRKSRRALSWVNLAVGRYFRERRQWERAEQHYAQSLTAAREADFLYGQWAVALERGTLLTQRMRYDQAVGELQRALELGRKLRAADQAEALVSVQLGDLYYYMDREELAEIYYQNIAELVEQTGFPSTSSARLYISLFNFVRLQDKERAIKYARKAYALRGGVDPLFKFQAIFTLADAYSLSGRSEEGLRLATEARHLAHRLGCTGEETFMLIWMSMEYYRLNRIEQMISRAREAVELTGPDNEDPEPRRVALQLQADGEMLRGNYEGALQLCLEALRTTERAWVREPVEELQWNYLAQSKAICTQIIMNLYALNLRHPNREYARQAFDFAERSRSRSLLQQLRIEQEYPDASKKASWLDRDQRLLEKISALERELVLLRAGGQADHATLDRLEERRARLVGERMRLQAEIRQTMTNTYHAAQLSPLTAEQVQKEFLAAHPNTAILFYQLGIQESFLIVLTRENAGLFKLPDWTTIGETVAEWRAYIRLQLKPAGRTATALRDYARIAHRLYEMLVRPAARIIRSRDLIIVPDRALYQLAFEGLIVSQPERIEDLGQLHYLVEDHSVTYAPSISALAEIERRQQRRVAKATKKLLLLGDAVFNERDPRMVQKRPVKPDQDETRTMAYGARLRAGLHRLPATRNEILSIARLAESYQWSPDVWLGFEASERNLKTKDLSVYGLVHLATHAIADPVVGDFSGIILSVSEGHSDDDGLLTAAEVSHLRLGADLVVLSGCATGDGQVTKAEGVVGLSRAFLIAGARRVCASLWKVEDDATRQLMILLYRHLLTRGQSLAHALQQAKIKFLRRGRLPFFWAPFVLIGAPD